MRINLIVKKYLNPIVLTLSLVVNSTNLYASHSATIEEIDDSFSSSHTTTSHLKMPFKLGFEFQEASGLCSWAKHDSRVQKKKLFEIIDKSTANPLWHMVIDSSDIEFVTEPFSHNERASLKKCIEIIVNSTNALHKLLTIEEEIPFKIFVKEIAEDASIQMKFFETYDLVKDHLMSISHISLKKEWAPYFSPQVTIQHPLEYTIPLYFSLFGFDNEYMPGFSTSLPLKDDFLKAQQEGDGESLKAIISQFKTKINGLIFLHALTMTSMAPIEYPSIKQYVESPEIFELVQRTSSLDLGNSCASLGKLGEYIEATLQADTQQLLETLQAFEKVDQVDPKMKLIIMSRRPFSLMFSDILDEDNPLNYTKYFKEVMLSKNLSFREVQRLFNKVNYAEQFFDPEEGTPRNLLFLKDCFKDSFFKLNSETIKALLEKGVVSTTMIRNFNENITLRKTPISLFFDRYFDYAMMSIDIPTHRITLDLEDENIQTMVKSTQWTYDLLSPPPLLDESNAMGRFRQAMTSEEEKFGEAIIEVRAIRFVQPWFLKKCELASKLSGSFLIRPEDIEQHSLALFNYLDSFVSNDFDYSIFEAGLSHSLRRY